MHSHFHKHEHVLKMDRWMNDLLTNAFDQRALALAIDFQIYGSIAVYKSDQWTGVHGTHRGDLIHNVVEFAGK